MMARSIHYTTHEEELGELRDQHKAMLAEVSAVLAQLDELAHVWGDEGVFRTCRERLRKIVTEGE
jgi:hypothetical protein